MADKISKAFNSTNLGEVIGIMQSYFGYEKYSIWHLFRDEKRKILAQITEKSLSQVATAFRDIYNDNYQLMTGIKNSQIPVPDFYKNAVEFIVNHDLHQFFENGRFSVNELRRLSSELKKWKVGITNEQSLSLVASERIFREIKRLDTGDTSLEDIQNLNSILDVLQDFKIDLNYWKGQNAYYSMLKGYKSGEWVFATKEWKEAFETLGSWLKMK